MLRLSLRVIAGALLYISVGAGSIAAQTGTITGTVSDNSGSPLANATVSVEGTGLRATTGGAGNYEIRSVPAGTQTLRVRLIGYESATQRVTVEAGGAARQDLTLTRSAVQLAPIDVVVGSRARHSTAEELAVPVDVYTAQDIQEQGTTETSQVLAALAPSVNFPHQTVTDANDIVRPFTLRGLSPDHTLVLVNGWRRHQTALLNTFPLGSPAGSSGVDLNAIPSSAIDRIEVLRDGASSQYGSDAIAGVVNIVMKEGEFVRFVNTIGGQYLTGQGLHRRRHHGRCERRGGDQAGPRLARPLRPVPEPRAYQPRLSRRHPAGLGRRHRRGRHRHRQDHPEAQRSASAGQPPRRWTGAGSAVVRQSPHAAQRQRVHRVLRLRRLQQPGRHRQRLLPEAAQQPELADDLPQWVPAGIPSQCERLLGCGRSPQHRSGWSVDAGGYLRPKHLRLPVAQHAEPVARPLPGYGLCPGCGRGPGHR